MSFAERSALLTPAIGLLLHDTCSASRPFMAAQYPVATTATPLSTCTTRFTPGTASAGLSSKPVTEEPSTGARATTAISTPSVCASIPNPAVPFTLPLRSSRLTGLPMSLKSFGSLSVTFSGTGIAAAATVSSPYPSLRRLPVSST